MRMPIANNCLTVQAIAGTYVVMLGISLPKSKAKKLLGVAVMRTDHLTGETVWMRGYKTFECVGGLPAPVVSVSSFDRPLQVFQWSDYSAKSGYAVPPMEVLDYSHLERKFDTDHFAIIDISQTHPQN